MNSFDETSVTDEERFLFIQSLYKRELDHQDSSPLWELADELEFSRTDAQQIADQLHRQGLLNFVSLSGHVALTSLGTFEVMMALSQPLKATRFFPPIAGFGDVQVDSQELDNRNLGAIVMQLREFCTDLTLTDDVSDKLSSLVDQLEMAVITGSRSSSQVVGELQAIDRLLTARLSA